MTQNKQMKLLQKDCNLINIKRDLFIVSFRKLWVVDRTLETGIKTKQRIYDNKTFAFTQNN